MGYQIGYAVGPTIDRGIVESYDHASSMWTLAYKSGALESVDLDDLNSRIRTRYEFDADTITAQQGLLPPLSSRFSEVSATFKELLAGCDQTWDDKHNPRSYFK